MDINQLCAFLDKLLRARHFRLSAIVSADDEKGQPDRELIQLSLKVVEAASRIDLSDLSSRLSGPPFYPDVWPGEHYKLLAGFVQVLQPRVVLEIGTATGLSALALKKFLPERSFLATFDVIPWQSYPGHVLRESDFADGKLKQVIADLSQPEIAHQCAQLFQSADLIFIDAAKDGTMESNFLNNFSKVGLKEGAILLFDDTRVLEMLGIWRRIALPKLDLTSFGHWSGTGMVRWTNRSGWN